MRVTVSIFCPPRIMILLSKNLKIPSSSPSPSNLSLLFYFLSFQLLTVVHSNDQSPPICIVGAGISGLSLGHLLQSKNETILILEKESTVGGKFEMFRQKNEVQVATGPILFPLYQDKIVKLVQKYNLTLIPFNDSQLALFEPYTGMVMPGREFMNLRIVQNAVLEAAYRYGDYQRKYVQNGSLDFGYLKAIETPELFLPLAEWLDERQLSILKPVFRSIMTMEGYGAIEDTPAIYTLQFIDGTILADVGLNPKGGLYTVYEGYDVLALKMAAGLPVQLNEEVVEIMRSSNGNRQVVKTRSRQKSEELIEYECKKVILAYPPLNLGKVIQDMSQEEKIVLGQVRVIKYAVGVHQIPPWEQAVYASLGTGIHPYFSGMMGNGNPIVFLRQSFKRWENIYSSYSWIREEGNEIPSTADLKVMEGKLNFTLKRLNDSGKVRTLSRIRQKHPYFPHVRTNALLAGFYNRLDNIQGIGGLYYATTLLTFECMHHAIRMAEGIVAKYF